MPRPGYIDPIACSEDEALAWFPISSGTARQAKRSMLDLGYEHEPMSFWRVRQEWMRPFNRDEDCPVSAEAHAAAIGTDEDPPDDCRCYYLEDGWHFPCEADHPDAIPVWRVEERILRVQTWIWRLQRRLHRRHYNARPVLWGGRPQKGSNRLERLLYGRGVILLLGDRQLRLGEARWQWCDVCGRETPHSLNRSRPFCVSDGHSDRLFRREIGATT